LTALLLSMGSRGLAPRVLRTPKHHDFDEVRAAFTGR